MTTKIRMQKDSIIYLYDQEYASLKTSGKEKITLWELHYKGTSNDTLTEIDAPDNEFDGSVPLAAEITCDTRANSVGSEYITWIADDGDGTTTTHYFYWDKAEITEVTCLAKADCTAETTFHFYVDDGAGGEDRFYVWINKSGTDSDPSETGTALEADISGATTAADVATIVAAAIDAQANVGAASADAVVTITNANNGDVTDCGDGEGEATGFSFSIEQGGDDPSATGTGHAVDISSDTTAANVADQLATDMTAIANITSTSSNAVTTAENDNHTADITDPVDSGDFASGISVLNSGTGEYSGGYLYIKSASSDDDDVAAGHCREVTVLGFDDSEDPISEVVSMSGTSYVKTTNKFKRVVHMYGNKFGSGDNDAAGNIILVDAETGNGTTYLTITAGETESNGARLYCPATGKFGIVFMRLVNITNANTGSTIVKIEFTGLDDESNITPDLDEIYAVCSQYRTSLDNFESKVVRNGSNTAKITIKEREMGTSGNEDFVFVFRIFTWK